MPRRQNSLFFTAFVFLLSLLALHTNAEESHPGMGLEPIYAEAVLEFNSKNSIRALELLDSILVINPKYIGAIELKALTLKTIGQSKRSLEEYHKLLRITSGKDRAPYHFELGSIYFKEKDFKQARYHLAQSARMQFNEGPSYFLLGIMTFQQGEKYIAKKLFDRALDKGTDDIKAASRFYLGLIALQTGRGNEGIYQILEAKKQGEKQPDNELSKQIVQASSDVLSQYDRTSWFGNLTLLAQYDTNVSLISDTVANSTGTSGSRSAKTTFIGSVGRAGSPMKSIQWLGSYRFIINKNFNKLTRSYEFASNIGTAYFTLNPLSRTSYGMKLEGTYTFQNILTDTTANTYTYKPYFGQIDIGPFLKHVTSSGIKFILEFDYKFQKYYQDPDDETSILVRSGNAKYLRFSASSDIPTKWFNPSGYIGYEIISPRGTEYRQRVGYLGVGNSFKPSDVTTINYFFDLTWDSYHQAQPTRVEKTFVNRVNYIRKINDSWSLLGDASYTLNKTTQPTSNDYKKLVVSAGATFSF